MSDADLIKECTRILGYQEGDMLSQVIRYTVSATNEIQRLRKGQAAMAAYIVKLQKLLPPEELLRMGIESPPTFT